MTLLVSIVVTFLCMPWPALIMMSPMMIAAPNFAAKQSNIIMAMVFFTYPTFIFLLLKGINYAFYGTNPIWWAAATCIVGLCISVLYGLPQQLMNVIQGISNYDYFITNNTVYLNGKKIIGADATTFTHFNNRGYYSKDLNHVYYNTKKLLHADAPTFQPLVNDDTKHFWHDKKNVYYAWKGITNADGSSIVYAGNGYAFDNRYVYFEDQFVEGADRNTFTVLFGHSGRDANNVFVRTVRATNVKDPKTFEMVFIQNEQFGKDKDQIYVIRYTPTHPLEPFPDADINSFEILGDYYAKDKNHVYYYHYSLNRIKILKDASSATFKVEYNNAFNTDATDGTHFYKAGELYEDAIKK